MVLNLQTNVFVLQRLALNGNSPPRGGTKPHKKVSGLTRSFSKAVLYRSQEGENSSVDLPTTCAGNSSDPAFVRAAGTRVHQTRLLGVTISLSCRNCPVCGEQASSDISLRKGHTPQFPPNGTKGEFGRNGGLASAVGAEAYN